VESWENSENNEENEKILLGHLGIKSKRKVWIIKIEKYFLEGNERKGKID